jgi:hypothetical protein
MKWYRDMIKSVTQHSYFEKKPNKKMGRFQNNPSIGCVHPKSTHAHPLAWGNKKKQGTSSACLGLAIGCTKFLFPKEFVTNDLP